MSTATQPSANDGGAKARAHMSKKRWEQLTGILKASFGDTDVVADALRQIQDVLQFDPQLSSYTPQQAKHIKNWEERKVLETGLSCYVATGKQRIYQQRRAAAVAARSAGEGQAGHVDTGVAPPT